MAVHAAETVTRHSTETDQALFFSVRRAAELTGESASRSWLAGRRRDLSGARTRRDKGNTQASLITGVLFDRVWRATAGNRFRPSGLAMRVETTSHVFLL
jgi:hypothetical protein